MFVRPLVSGGGWIAMHSSLGADAGQPSTIWLSGPAGSPTGHELTRRVKSVDFAIFAPVSARNLAYRPGP